MSKTTLRIGLVGGPGDGGYIDVADATSHICMKAGKERTTGIEMYDLYGQANRRTVEGDSAYEYQGRFAREEAERVAMAFIVPKKNNKEDGLEPH